MNPNALLILPRLRVQNANATSTALTWGFPSPSAFTGFAHALHRKTSEALAIDLNGVAIVCHSFEPQVSQPSGKRTKTFHLTRNPLNSDGSSAALVEEGRAHLEVSLIIGATGSGLAQGISPEALTERIDAFVESMRLAGGSILPRNSTGRGPELLDWPAEPEDQSRLSKKVLRRLLPGFALVSRTKLLADHWDNMRAVDPTITQLDAFLDLSSLNFEPSNPPERDQASRIKWTARRKDGWLVPIPAGYRAISELYEPGSVRNTRDRETPFRFVEGVYSMGQWLSPHRVRDVRTILWENQFDADRGVYRWLTPYFDQLNNSEGE